MISVLLPVYNRDQYLAEAINSILNQKHKGFELIVVDDGSTDSTPDLLRWYVAKDKRIKVFTNEKNMGIAYTRNRAISESSGEYIAVMDSDDVANPNRLEKSLKMIKNVDFVYSHYLQANQDAQVEGGIEAPAKLTIPNIIEGFTAPHVTILAKRKCFIEHPYDNRFKVNDDLALVCSWVKAGYTYKLINQPLMIVRYHENSASKTRDKEVKEFTELVRKEFDVK